MAKASFIMNDTQQIGKELLELENAAYRLGLQETARLINKAHGKLGWEVQANAGTDSKVREGS